MPDDKLRIGGWIPPDPEETKQLPVLAQRRQPLALRDRRTGLVPLGPDRGPRRVIILCVVAAVAGAVGMLALIRPGTDKTVQPPIAGPMIFATPSEGSSPASPPPSPSLTTGGPTPASPRSTVRPAGHRPVTTTPAPKPSSAPKAALTVGSVIGLEVDGQSGLRLRHYNFGVRVDRLSSSSSALDRADSRFTVRSGLAFGGCLSFEAVNYPGYYLRHRVFDMVLEQRDDSRVFDQESTFCAKPTRDGKAFTFVTFYPSEDYGLTTGFGGWVQVSDATEEPTRFVVRKPL
jgi:hypothetical protein